MRNLRFRKPQAVNVSVGTCSWGELCETFGSCWNVGGSTFGSTVEYSAVSESVRSYAGIACCCVLKKGFIHLGSRVDFNLKGDGRLFHERKVIEAVKIG